MGEGTAEHDPAAYGAAFADVYDDWYSDVSDAEATAELVADLAGGDPVLELGIGTGRLALPIAARGVEIHGIDASAAMVERLRRKPGGEAIPVTVSDFTDVPVSAPGGFGVVLIAYNTFFNLPTGASQGRCLGAAAQRLRPGGAVVIEAFVPDPDSPSTGCELKEAGEDRAVATIYRRLPGSQVAEGAVVCLDDRGPTMRPWRIRWATPDQLDDMAEAAGLVREHRWAGWRREPYDGHSDRHVTVWRRPGG